MIIPNRLELCKSIALLALLLAHILMGTDVLQQSALPTRILSDKTLLKKFSLENLFPMVTQRAPHFEGTAVINKKLTTISLSQYSGKYVVLLFYALDFSSLCPAEVTAFSDRVADFHKLNAAVIACSVDSPYAHMTWLQMPRQVSGLGDIKIPLLSDLTHKISEEYGVYVPALGHSLRAQFIIDSNGIIRQATINDLFVARSVDETLRTIRNCRCVDRTGNPVAPLYQQAESSLNSGYNQNFSLNLLIKC